MKLSKFIFLALLCATTIRAEPDDKQSVMQQIVELYDITATVEDAKHSVEGQARATADKMFDQMKSSMPNLPEQYWNKMAAAADKMIAAVQQSWSTQDAVQVWQTEYAREFSADELKKILEASKTPLGRKQIAAGKRANSAFTGYLVDRNKAVGDKAMKDYIAELQLIISDISAAPKQDSASHSTQ